MTGIGGNNHRIAWKLSSGLPGNLPPDYVETITGLRTKQVPADDSRERKLTGQLNIYYDAVIASIRAADSLLLFGPGEARGELTKRLERHHYSGRIVGSETADKMTPRQIAAKVRQYFHAKSGWQAE